MTKEREYPKPLTFAQVKRLKALPPEADPPGHVAINLNTFRLPKGVKAQIIEIEGSTDLFQVQIQLPGGDLGRRTPYDRIPALKLDRNKLKESELEAVKPEGLRPLHLPVDFLPTKVKLTLAERAHPPFNFKYPKGVDRPTNVFAPDQRYIYQDTSFPWCTVGRVDTPLGTCTWNSRVSPSTKMSTSISAMGFIGAGMIIIFSDP